jgi:hypothetical protein
MEKLLISTLLSSIEWLAANPENQREYLKNLGSFPSLDELALEFDDVYPAFKAQTASQAIMPESILVKIENLDYALNLLSDSADKSVWDESSLDTENWVNIRNIASSVLKDIHLLEVLPRGC